MPDLIMRALFARGAFQVEAADLSAMVLRPNTPIALPELRFRGAKGSSSLGPSEAAEAAAHATANFAGLVFFPPNLRKLVAMNWSQTPSPSLDEFERLARQAFVSLPDTFRALAGDIVFMVQDFPDEEVMNEMELESAFDILGLFQGADLASRESGQHGAEPTMIFLYRRPILDYWADHDEGLGHIIRHVLIHEIGHHFGLSDEAMEAIEEA